jgi:hypothetical protein
MPGNSKRPHCAGLELCCLWASASGTLYFGWLKGWFDMEEDPKLLKIIKRKIGNEYWWTLSDPSEVCLVKPSCGYPSKSKLIVLYEDCPHYHVYCRLFGAHFPTKKSLKTYLLTRKNYNGLIDCESDE